MKQNYILFLSVLTLSISTIFAQSPLDDGTIAATETFNTVTVPTIPSDFFTYRGFTTTAFLNSVDINAASDIDGTGLGVTFNYDPFQFNDEEIVLKTFTNVAPGDYIVQYDINAQELGFAYEPFISDGTTRRGSFVTINSGNGSFQKRYTAQISISNTSDISFSMLMSPVTFAFFNSEVKVDNVELIKMNSVLPITVAGSTVEQQENYDAATAAPFSSGSPSFITDVILSQDADVNNTGQGVEFEYNPRSYLGQTVNIDLVTFSNVPAGTYYIDYQYDDNFTGTIYDFSYYNQITDGTTSLNNYVITERVPGFITQRTREITTTTTGDITLKWFAGDVLNNVERSQTLYADNVRLLKVPAITLNVNSLDKPTFELYPNPTSDYINISGLQQVENFIIYTALGQVVKKGTVANNESINVSNFSSGLYLLKLENGRFMKFIKE